MAVIIRALMDRHGPSGLAMTVSLMPVPLMTVSLMTVSLWQVAALCSPHSVIAKLRFL
jgi:hypothetical protein